MGVLCCGKMATVLGRVCSAVLKASKPATSAQILQNETSRALPALFTTRKDEYAAAAAAKKVAAGKVVAVIGAVVDVQVAEVFTGHAGKLVPLEETIKGFKKILAGEFDHIPEQAFYMVGPIEEVIEKAEKLAQ